MSRADCAVGEMCRDGRCVPAVDAGLDAGTLDDAGSLDDAGALDDASMLADAGSVDAALGDAGGVGDSGVLTDGGATTDGGPANTCVAAGGTCERPGLCTAGIVGDPALYACSGGLRLACCLPRNTPPICAAIGTRAEGWVAPDGTRICGARCDGATLTCSAIGTRSEGWYAEPASAACMPAIAPALVEWTNCAP